MDILKVGVIGVGMMGQRHCRVYSNLRSVSLIGVCDSSTEAGKRVADQYNVSFFDDVDQLLTEVDAVSLVTPTPLHFDLALRCLEKGVHVLIEKPITETVEQGKILTRMVESNDVVVQVGHIERFNPGYVELKNVLGQMTVAAINLRRLSSFEGSNTDVDVVLDLMIHDIDLALDLIGREPVALDAHGLTSFSGVIDHAVAHLIFEGGPIVTMTASRVTEQKIRSVEITALEAYLEADLLSKSISVHRRTIGEILNSKLRGGTYRQESIVERIHVPTFEPLFLELQHFVQCVLEKEPTQIPARDGLRALRVATQLRDIIHERMVTVKGKVSYNGLAL